MVYQLHGPVEADLLKAVLVGVDKNLFGLLQISKSCLWIKEMLTQRHAICLIGLGL